jgi:predicted mannosyl-3-phosphoglycerate phosphatase (HAD superfamily)
MIFAVDFDGTIVEHEYPEIGEELPNATPTLKALQACGHKIIIWTCRSGKELGDTKRWLEARGFIPDECNTNVSEWGKLLDSPKVYADVYIDDRSFPPFNRYSGWIQVHAKFVRLQA